jgi:hypothetical protein
MDAKPAGEGDAFGSDLSADVQRRVSLNLSEVFRGKADRPGERPDLSRHGVTAAAGFRELKGNFVTLGRA